MSSLEAVVDRLRVQFGKLLKHFIAEICFNLVVCLKEHVKNLRYPENPNPGRHLIQVLPQGLGDFSVLWSVQGSTSLN